MAITKSQAQTSVKNLLWETCKLYPNTLITLFELDCQDLLIDKNIITSAQVDPVSGDPSIGIFRFHNNLKTSHGTSLWWNDLEYRVAPIKAEGFEITSKGTLPTPRLSITTNEDGIDQLSLLKQRLYELGDLTGSKVTRIRTFLKFLDSRNYFDDDVNENLESDPNAEFPRDVYYIDRKSNENKFLIEYELASILDVEGIKLPRRLVFAERCPWTYRGEGCRYEHNSRRNDDVHGSSSDSTLPSSAPPVANELDEDILDIINQTSVNDRGLWQPSTSYSVGDAVYVEKKGVKYYFVAKASTTVAPPNPQYWISDQCSKTMHGCRLRFGVDGSVSNDITKGRLPFGGFPGCNKFYN